MPVLTLPDGSTRSFDGPVTGADLAANIGAGLAKAALAITVDGEEYVTDEAPVKNVMSKLMSQRRTSLGAFVVTKNTFLSPAAKVAFT